MNYCLEGDFIQYSNNFGYIDNDSNLFDDSQDLGGTEELLLQYLIKKIKIYTDKKYKKEFIYGIQITYQNIKTKEIKELPIRINNREKYFNKDFQIIELLSGEYLTNFNIRFGKEAEYIYQISFETNKKRKILIGSECEETKNIKDNDEENIILGTYGYYNRKIDSFGVLYVNLKDYLKKFYTGYFELKIRLKKDKKFLKENQEKFETFSKSNKFLLKTCLLPDASFNEIIKFCIF